ncbi:MAG: O-antigen ligase family protein [Actinomycetota bacterium]|nr:O-antigen ligase family protein [Actinomycetota bacterium]
MEHPGSGRATTLAAAIALAVMSAVWIWWVCKEGAYFGAVMYPGLIVLCAGLVLVQSRAAWNEALALSIPVKLALGGLIGLGTWSALSAMWSPAPDVAVADAQRIFGYAIAFGLGIWLRVLLRDRSELAMVPLAAAGLAAGGYAVATLLTGDDFARYVDRGTLQFPLGYRNANAAFFLIAMLPAALLATSRSLDWRLRGVALASATLCLELAILSQSRASVVAAGVALAVLLIVSRERARATGWLLLAILPALFVIPAVNDLFATGDLENYMGTTELRAAGRAALAGSAIALVLGAAVAFAGARLTPSEERAGRANRAVGLGAVGLAVAAVAGFVVSTGDPARWVEDRFDEFLTQGTPEAGETETRFEVNAGSERDDFWRVAIEVAEDEPLLGVGGGGYHYSFLLERDENGAESVRDAHSVELEILSELGIVGLALFAVALAGACAGAWQSRRLGGAEALLAACALAVAAYWLAHASLDWFWPYAGVTAPVFGLLGSAAAPAASRGERRAPGATRLVAAGAACILAVSVIPPYLAERYVDAAYAGWRDDLERAEANLDRAQSLNPLSIEPLLAEGAILRASNQDEGAIAAFEEAASERPEEWAPHYFLALLQRSSNPQDAKAELEKALALNPLSADLAVLKQRLAASRD